MNSVALSIFQTVICLFILAAVFVHLFRVDRKNESKPRRRLNVHDISDVPEAKGCRRVALLIDADNIGSEYVGKIMKSIGKVCDAAVVYMCVYGIAPSQNIWMSAAQEYGMEQKYLTNFLKRKNSTDFRIVIDCMDLLYTEDIDVFVLCSSDSDFSGIAERLTQDGKMVVGMGMDYTPDVFRDACAQFFPINLPDASVPEIEKVLRNLVSFYGNNAYYGKMKNLVAQRFDVDCENFGLFDKLLRDYGYGITSGNVITLPELEVIEAEHA